jgi:hypothetical protein
LFRQIEIGALPYEQTAGWNFPGNRLRQAGCSHGHGGGAAPLCGLARRDADAGPDRDEA